MAWASKAPWLPPRNWFQVGSQNLSRTGESAPIEGQGFVSQIEIADALRRHVKSSPGSSVRDLQKFGNPVLICFCASGYGRLTFIAMHRGDLPEGTFRKILKQARIGKNDFDRL